MLPAAETPSSLVKAEEKANTRAKTPKAKAGAPNVVGTPTAIRRRCPPLTPLHPAFQLRRIHALPPTRSLPSHPSTIPTDPTSTALSTDGISLIEEHNANAFRSQAISLVLTQLLLLALPHPAAPTSNPHTSLGSEDARKAQPRTFHLLYHRG